MQQASFVELGEFLESLNILECRPQLHLSVEYSSNLIDLIVYYDLKVTRNILWLMNSYFHVTSPPSQVHTIPSAWKNESR